MSDDEITAAIEALNLRAQFEAERRTRWSEADAEGNVTVTYTHPFTAQVGPFHSAEGAARLMGISIEELEFFRGEWLVLGVETTDGVWVYPSFQWDDSRTWVLPWLTAVLQVLRGVDRWSAALWLTEPNAELGDRTPLQAGYHGELMPVLMLAGAYSAAAANR